MKNLVFVTFLLFSAYSVVHASSTTVYDYLNPPKSSLSHIKLDDLRMAYENSSPIELVNLRNPTNQNEIDAKSVYDTTFHTLYAAVEQRRFPPVDLTDTQNVRGGSHSSKYSLLHWINKNSNYLYDPNSWSHYKAQVIAYERGDREIAYEDQQCRSITKLIQLIMLAKGFIITNLYDETNMKGFLQEMGDKNLEEFCDHVIKNQVYNSSTLQNFFNYFIS